MSEAQLRLVFFLNCVSPHQMPYIKELPLMPEVAEVWVVAPCVTIAERTLMGWSGEVPAEYAKVPRLHFLIAPKDEEVIDLLCRQAAAGRTVGLFGGIRADRDVFRWVKLSLAVDMQRAIITEPPLTYKTPLWMHKVRFALRDWWLVPKFDWVFAIGAGCADYYKAWSHRWQVCPFVYCTEKPVLCGEARVPDDEVLHVLTVSALSVRKNVGLMLNALAQMPEPLRSRVSLTVVGDGEQRELLETETKRLGLSHEVTFVGNQEMAQVPRWMAQNDVLALPSLYDGWGAVVNEALMLGLDVMCSGRCGARMLIDECPMLGTVVDSLEPSIWAKALEEKLLRLADLRLSRQKRVDWANENLSGKAVASYMVNRLRNNIVM